MSVKAMNWVFENSTTALGARLVLLALADHADPDGKNAWQSVPTLARQARMSERQVQRTLQNLVEEGHILITGESSRRTRIYAINMGHEGDILSPCEPDERVTDCHPSVTFPPSEGDISALKGDIAVSPKRPDPSVDPFAFSCATAREPEEWLQVFEAFKKLYPTSLEHVWNWVECESKFLRRLDRADYPAFLEAVTNYAEFPSCQDGKAVLNPYRFLSEWRSWHPSVHPAPASTTTPTARPPRPARQASRPSAWQGDVASQEEIDAMNAAVATKGREAWQ